MQSWLRCPTFWVVLVHCTTNTFINSSFCPVDVKNTENNIHKCGMTNFIWVRPAEAENSFCLSCSCIVEKMTLSYTLGVTLTTDSKFWELSAVAQRDVAICGWQHRFGNKVNTTTPWLITKEWDSYPSERNHQPSCLPSLSRLCVVFCCCNPSTSRVTLLCVQRCSSVYHVCNEHYLCGYLSIWVVVWVVWIISSNRLQLYHVSLIMEVHRVLYLDQFCLRYTFFP